MNSKQWKQSWDLFDENPLIRIGQHPVAHADEVYVYFYRRQVLLTEGNDIFHKKSFDKGFTKEKVFCGEVLGQNCYGIELKEKELVPHSYWIDLKDSRSIISLNAFALVSRAMQLIEWLRQHKFCGSCGEQTSREPAGYLECKPCSLVHYPRISPSMIVLISRGSEVLLARSPRFPPGVYSPLAGFLEPGESVEQCVHREVFEEVGVKIKNLKYQGSQSWPFPHSLMLGFFADYESGDIVCEPGEIEDARWWKADDLPAIPPKGSISAWLIQTRVAQITSAY
ncbi:MAG: NAD(+) diphosphatase [Oligoflexales bacterium]|nr:NAD(+) diphosphatase [Oligoflexales bacterium]